MLNEKTLKNQELAALRLRSLYSRFGYSRFKMSKFEEYDLYVRNKDFLISDGIITFTDTNGKLMALKPDVTLSIIKNSADGEGLQKLYYDENVYRISGDSRSFKEITQTGLECIGNVSLYNECEVLSLALSSLETIDDDFILDISHAGLVSCLLDELCLDGDTRKCLVTAIRSKSRDGAVALFDEGRIDEKGLEIANKLIANYPDSEGVKAAFEKFGAEDQLARFLEILETLQKLGYKGKINIDFSIVNDQSYYSGVVFKGYINGIPTEVLSGGRYDKLMKKMGRNTGAIGFAVYLDLLERHGTEKSDFDYDYIVANTESADTAAVISAVAKLSQNGDRVAVMQSVPTGVSCKQIIDFNDLEGKI